MRMFVACALLLGVSWSQASTDFDFLLGEHDVALHAWTPAGWSPPRPVNAQWHGRRGLRDAVIIDEWFDPQAGDGVNVRLYDQEEQLWHMMWISTNGKQVQDLRAEVRDGKLIMWQVYPERPDWRAEFIQLNHCAWAREDGKMVDGSWQPGFRLVATKRECEAR